MSKLLRILGLKQSDDPVPIVSILIHPHWQRILEQAAKILHAPLVSNAPSDGYYILVKHEQQATPAGIPPHTVIVDFPLTSPEIALQRAILHVKASRRLSE